MSTSRKKVVIISVTGNSGEPIARGLVESGKFSITGTVRPLSLDKPIVKDFKALGITIVPIDWQTAPQADLEALFADADTVISTCSFAAVSDQPRLADAAKAAGVKRFVPSEWASVCPPGVMLIEDTKRVVRDYIQKINLPYTIIQVGGWYQVEFPPLSAQSWGNGKLYNVYGGGETATASCDRRNMGRFVARIIDDDETLGKYVLAHEEEVAQNRLWALAEKYAPGRLAGRRVDVSAEELDRLIRKAEQSNDLGSLIWNQYMKSSFVSGHNSVAAAKKDGWLIARELYPDVPVCTAEEYAKEIYSTSECLNTPAMITSQYSYISLYASAPSKL
ncbi:hypothetical protein HGRIS_008895 [Hohenbuehelia grisea]|uniref:NmrA-like domain-containing protein n=1 Tax=Hohenbuehelia grisea TaxID=104357 RepID=A0ABR3IZL6_9AGAR